MWWRRRRIRVRVRRRSVGVVMRSPRLSSSSFGLHTTSHVSCRAPAVKHGRGMVGICMSFANWAGFGLLLCGGLQLWPMAYMAIGIVEVTSGRGGVAWPMAVSPPPTQQLPDCHKATVRPMSIGEEGRWRFISSPSSSSPSSCSHSSSSSSSSSPPHLTLAAVGGGHVGATSDE